MSYELNNNNKNNNIKINKKITNKNLKNFFIYFIPN